MKLLGCLFLLFAISILVTVLARDVATATESDTNYLTTLEKTAKANWRCSEKEPKPVTITFFVAQTGQIYNAQVKTSSGAAQTDAECLEALCELAPVSLNPARHLTGDLTQVEMTFQKSNSQPLIENSEVLSYFSKHPDLQKNFVAIHLLPVDILKRKITGIRKEDITSPSNLRLIQIGPSESSADNESNTYSRAVKTVYANWGAFFEVNPKPTKAQVDKKSSEIESALSGKLRKL
ncbi:hypothetical protein BH10CYA1_BH10CYA1_42800 [soil metagenome]